MSILFENLLVKQAGEKDGEEYKAYFAKKLAAAGYASPADIPEDKKKAFYDSVDKGWSSDKEDRGSDTGNDKKDVEKKASANSNRYFVKAAEMIIGGKADGIPAKAFDLKEVQEGIDIEKEHTGSDAMALEIAKDHLQEIPDYYSRLKEMEDEAKKEKEEEEEEKEEEKEKEEKVDEAVEKLKEALKED